MNLVAKLDLLLAGEWRLCELIDFHTDHKFEIMAHSPSGLRRLGRLLGEQIRADRNTLARHYREILVEISSHEPAAGHHEDVLQHALGFLKTYVDPGVNRLIVGRIEAYRKGSAPLGEPKDWIRRYADRHQISYLMRQSYFRRMS